MGPHVVGTTISQMPQGALGPKQVGDPDKLIPPPPPFPPSSHPKIDLVRARGVWDKMAGAVMPKG